MTKLIIIPSKTIDKSKSLHGLTKNHVNIKFGLGSSEFISLKSTSITNLSARKISEPKVLSEWIWII